MNFTADNNTCQAKELFEMELWSIKMKIFVTVEIIIAVLAIVGNSLVFYVFFREKKLRRRINYYILSLAISDFCVGAMGIPLGLYPVSHLNISIC